MKLVKWVSFILLFVSSALVALEGQITHRQGDGIGYKRQYSKIGVYHAFEDQAFQPFIDLRYLVLNKGKQGANIGAGLGYQFEQQNRLSAYAYFDLLESRTNHIFNQMTAGLSYTHPLIVSNKDWGEFTCYLNGYFPLKSVEKRIKKESFAGFKGNHLLINQTDHYALTGSNLELGYLSTSWNNWNAYIAGSAYYFKRAELHGFGGYGKLRIIYNDLISLEGQVSGDRLFGTNISGTLGIRIPFGKREMKAVKNRSYCVHKSRPIERLEPIVLEKNSRKVVAKDSSGTPLNFIFVNNLNGSNGTFEDPFATLLDAQNISNPGDIIYVFPGDGTTKGMDAGFTMLERQTLAGSGNLLAVATSRGEITVPALTSQGPLMTNLAGNGVDIARDCTVSGITVSNANLDGFSYLQNDGTSTINLLFCKSMNSVSEGFDFNTTGSSQSTIMLDHCSAMDSTRNGFHPISDDSSQLTFMCNDCSAIASGIDNFGVGANDTSTMSVTLNRCIVDGSGGGGGSDGFFLTSRNDSKINMILNQCSAINCPDDGFNPRSREDSLMSVMVNECFAADCGAGFEFRGNSTNNQVINVSNSSSVNNSAEGFKVGTTGSALSGSLTNCSGTGNGASSFDVNTIGIGAFTIPNDTTLSIEL